MLKTFLINQNIWNTYEGVSILSGQMEMGRELCWAIWEWGGDDIGPCEGGVMMVLGHRRVGC